MSIIYRESVLADLDAICHHREAMFVDIGHAADSVDAMHAPFRQWLEPRLADGRYFGATAENDGQDIGHAGAFLIDWPPGMLHPDAPMIGDVINVHVEPDFRRRGIARALMHRIEMMMRQRGLRFGMLQASEYGRPLYTDLGWSVGSDMRKTLD